MLLVLGTFRVPPARLAGARTVMARMIAASRAEDGCLAYDYAENMLEPGLIHVHERWRDQAALDAHAASDHIRAWRAEWPALGIGSRALMAFDGAAGRPI